MDEANSTSQHFDPVSKFFVYNLNPPEIVWVPCPILPHKLRKKKKNTKMTLEKMSQKRGVGYPFGCYPVTKAKNQIDLNGWGGKENQRTTEISQVMDTAPAFTVTTKKSSITPGTWSPVIHFIGLKFKFTTDFCTYTEDITLSQQKEIWATCIHYHSHLDTHSSTLERSGPDIALWILRQLFNSPQEMPTRKRWSSESWL